MNTKGGLAIKLMHVIKQKQPLCCILAINSTPEVIELEEKLNKLQQEVHTLIEQEPANLENSISSLAKRLDNFSISGNLPVKRTDEQIYVFEDQSKIFKEQFGKESKKWLLEGLTSSTEVLHNTETFYTSKKRPIRGYCSKWTRGRYQAARATTRVFRRNNYNLTLESAVDPERQLELSRERLENLVLAEVLYSNNRSTKRHRVYQHYSEQRILMYQ
ncbi:hypothetical protein Tco_0421879 [Tanacetum coccineum]